MAAFEAAGIIHTPFPVRGNPRIHPFGARTDARKTVRQRRSGGRFA